MKGQEAPEVTLCPAVTTLPNGRDSPHFQRHRSPCLCLKLMEKELSIWCVVCLAWCYFCDIHPHKYVAVGYPVSRLHNSHCVPQPQFFTIVLEDGWSGDFHLLMIVNKTIAAIHVPVYDENIYLFLLCWYTEVFPLSLILYYVCLKVCSHSGNLSCQWCFACFWSLQNPPKAMALIVWTDQWKVSRGQI